MNLEKKPKIKAWFGFALCSLLYNPQPIFGMTGNNLYLKGPKFIVTLKSSFTQKANRKNLPANVGRLNKLFADEDILFNLDYEEVDEKITRRFLFTKILTRFLNREANNDKEIKRLLEQFTYMPKALRPWMNAEHVVLTGYLSGKQRLLKTGMVLTQGSYIVWVEFFGKSNVKRSIQEAMKSIVDTARFVQFSERSYEHYLIGQSHYNKGRFNKAKENFLLALKVDEKNDKALFGLGLIEHAQKNFEKAEKYYKECQSINSNHSEAKYQMAQVLIFRQKYKNAKQILKTLRNTIGYAAKTCYLASLIELRKGRKQEAETILKKCIDMYNSAEAKALLKRLNK